MTMTLTNKGTHAVDKGKNKPKPKPNDQPKPKPVKLPLIGLGTFSIAK